MMDTDLLDWMEENADEITISRDLRKGAFVTVDFCYDVSGCPGQVTGASIREAVQRAAEEQNRKK